MRLTTWDASTPTPKGIDPPKRMNWINNMKPHKRATAMLRLYLDKRIGNAKDRDEAKLAKDMLRKLNAVQADGNPMGVELAIMHAERPCVQIFFNVHGIGPVVWLPMLVLQSNTELEHIVRETGPNRVALDYTEYVPKDPDVPIKRLVAEKIKAAMIPGRTV